MIQLSNYLSPIFHLGFSRSDSVFVYVHESIKYELVCTKANLCHKIIASTNKNHLFCFGLPVHLSVLQTFFNIEGDGIVTNWHFQFNGLPTFFCRRYDH